MELEDLGELGEDFPWLKAGLMVATGIGAVAKKIKEGVKGGDPLDAPLVLFSEKDAFTVRNACEGVQIFGATGSGKSSGSGKTLATAYLKAGFGGIVLCAKGEERHTWEAYAKEMGREEDILIFSPLSELRFNFLDYELKRGGEGAGLTENIVRLFTTIIEASNMQKQGGGNSDPFWQDTLKQLLRNAVELSALAREEVSVPLLHAIIMSAPQDEDQVHDEEWQAESLCHIMLEEAFEKSKSASKEQDFAITATYWLREFPALSEKTRSVILASFTSIADLFLRGDLRDLFSTKTNFLPEFLFAGKILIVDMPVSEYGDVGKLAALLLKYVVQRAILRRNVKEFPNCVFVWADESQNFISELDPAFQAECRSLRGCTVYLTQNIPYYRVVLGAQSENRVNAFMGNLQTKIFHQNSDVATNLWAASLFGKDWQVRQTVSTGSSSAPGMKSSSSTNASIHESLEHVVQPIAFTILRKGGKHNELKVDALVYKGGDIFEATAANHIMTTFTQG